MPDFVVRNFAHRKNRHAEVDGRGVDSIESPMQLEFSDDAFPLGNLHHIECKLLKDAVVSDGISPRKHLPIDRKTPKSKKKCFVGMSSCVLILRKNCLILMVNIIILGWRFKMIVS